MTTLAPILQLPTSAPANPLALVAARLGGILDFPNRRYDVRVSIQSQSVDQVVYKITRDRETGQWRCGCPGKIYSLKPDFRCKHLREWVPALHLALELQELALPMPGGVWQHPGE